MTDSGRIFRQSLIVLQIPFPVSLIGDSLRRLDNEVYSKMAFKLRFGRGEHTPFVVDWRAVLCVFGGCVGSLKVAIEEEGIQMTWWHGIFG
jgi:hypothetical protein